MSVELCPLFEAAYYTYTIDLSGETFSLTFRWNERAQQWLMDIEDAQNEKIARGVALVSLYPLLEQLSLVKPVGEFVLVPYDTTSPQIDNPRELYKTHYLVYDDRGS